MNVIDLNKLEGKTLQSDGSYICMCPACAEEGRNLQKKDHLRVWKTGQFNCIANNSDKAHNFRILQLVGTKSTGELNSNYLSPQSEQPKIEISESWPLSILGNLIKDYTYFESRGISMKTQSYFQMGVAGKGYFNGRVIIPIFDEKKTKIVGISGRLIDDKNEWHTENKTPKWKHKGSKLKEFLWPYEPEVIKKSSNSIILVESPGDVLYLWEMGVRNTICLFGTTLSPKILGYLIRLNPSKILISTNNDRGHNVKNHSVGNNAAEKIKVKLMNYFNGEKLVIALPELGDFGDYFSHIDGRQLLREWESRYLKS